MLGPWQSLQSRTVGDYRVFRLRHDRKLSPRTGEPHDFYVLDSSDWVNVIALTPRDELVMVEQYRHGTNTVELEVPGGIQDAEDTSPEAAAVRELREETGYEGEGARVLGDIAANPAIMNNTCHIVCIRNCELRHEVALDGGEDLETRLVPVGEINSLVAAGRVRHSIVLVALYFLDLWRRDLKP